MSEQVTGARVIRQSQGDDGSESVSLEIQRERMDELAEDIGIDDVETYDLGVQTGFSIHMIPESNNRIDNNPDVLNLLEKLRDGAYDYLLAYDHTRLARDQFYWEFKRAALTGEWTVQFVDERPEDGLTFRVERAVENEVKLKEMEKAREAFQHRQNTGKWNTRTPVGLEFDDDREYLVASEQFTTVVDALAMRAVGTPFRSIADETGLSRGAIERWLNHIEERVQACRNDDTARTLVDAAPDDAIGEYEGDIPTHTSREEMA